MADLYVKELEGKVAHYEAIMSSCPQCKTNLPTSEAESTTRSSRHCRSSRSAQQPVTKEAQPALTGPSKRPAPEPTLSSSTQSSKQLRPTSRKELQTSKSQQCTPSLPPAASSNRSHQTIEAPVPTLRHPSKTLSDPPTTGCATASAADTSGPPTTSFQKISTRPSSLALSTADGRHHHSGNLVDLNLQQYKKPRSRKPGGRPPGESPRHAEWMRMADIMLEEVPSGRDWRKNITGMDNSIIAAVAMSATPVPQGDVSPREDVERKELIRLVRRFAERHSEGRVNFEHFILVCLCKVLSSQGVPQGKIVETLQICISDTSKVNIERYLKGATWANKIMSELFLEDWGYRAVDLIAIWNRTVATYGKLAAAPDSRQYFITDLTQRKYFEGYQEVPGRRHDTIPWIVKKELGNEVSYRDICEALGYSEEYILKTRSLHSSQPSSPNMDSGASTDEDASPGRRSLHTGRKLASRASSHPSQRSADISPDRTSASASNLLEASMLRRQLHQEDSPEDSGGRKDPSMSESIASHKTKRAIPDRSAKPLGDLIAVRRRRKPYENSSLAGLPVPTSLGESTSKIQSSKRPLPVSPTSAFQPINATRRHQNPMERSSREEMGPSSELGKKGSKY